MAKQLEKRIEMLEQQVARLQRRQGANGSARSWVNDVYGAFAGDPLFEQAMRLGRQYRRSLRPGARKAKTKR